MTNLVRAMICLALFGGGFFASTQAAEEAKPAENQTEATVEETKPEEKKGETEGAKADEEKKEAEEEKEGKEETKSEPTREQVFEGGEKIYPNWVEVAAGGFWIGDNEKQARAMHRLSSPAFGGLQDFHYQREVAKNTTLAGDGRALFDNHDYKLSLDLAREENWFVRFNYEQFRTWYNGDGGYYPPGDAWYSLSDDALALDRGEISFEAGLTLKKMPKLAFRYAHQWRDGEKSSTIWGQTHPTGTTLVRGLAPSFYDIDETRDIFELDATHRIKKTDFGLGLRYETGDLDNSRKTTQWPGEPSIQRKITNREGTSYDLFNVHAFSETWIKKNLLFTTGFQFADLDNDFSGSRIYGETFDAGYVPNALNGLGYTNLLGNSHKNEYTVNLNLWAMPLKHVVIVPSVRVQWADWDADSGGIGTLGTAAQPFDANSQRDLLDVRERLELRYTGVTNWVLYAGGEWTQGEGNLEESGGLSQVNGIGVAPIQRETDDSRFFQKYSAGARWYPARNLSLDLGGYYRMNAYDYDHTSDSTANGTGSPNRYPAYLVTQDFETYDGNVRVTFRPWRTVSLMTRYEYQLSTIHTAPDSISGLGETESSEMTSHIIGQNVSWMPWTRLYFQAGFSYVLSETTTPASDYTQAILDSQNNYWTLNFNAGLVLDDKTDLNLGYFYYQADNYEDNSEAGLPLGVGAEEHGITATLTRRLTANLRLILRYGYFLYDDETSGGNNDYDAHVLYSSLQYRF